MERIPEKLVDLVLPAVSLGQAVVCVDQILQVEHLGLEVEVFAQQYIYRLALVGILIFQDLPLLLRFLFQCLDLVGRQAGQILHRRFVAVEFPTQQ